MVTAPIRPLELDLLCQKLEADYAELITGTGTSPESRRSNFLSKAIAAFVLHEAAGATPEEVVAASIDGGLDHGIDSVFVAKFRDGVADLIQGRWGRFNNALQNRSGEIANALNSGVCKVKVVLAYSGTAVSDDRRDIFSDLERAFNGPNPGFLRCHAYWLTTLHDLHLDGISALAIEADVELKDFGYTQAPYRAFYGRMDAKRLAELWVQYEDRLVDRIIRRFKGTTTVNAGLTETLQQEAEHFFYFNNGVTFLCEAINEQHPRDPHGESGRLPPCTLPAREVLAPGAWMVLRVIFIRLPLHNGAELSLSADELTVFSREIDLVADRLVIVVQAVQWNKQARSVFENKTDCRSLKGRLMAALAQQNQGGLLL